jgi:chromosome segregation ATPase
MLRYISRNEIIKELGISLKELIAYEDYLEVPRPIDDKHDFQIASLIARLNELVKAGLSLNDIKHLSFCAETFQDLIPEIKDFKDFAPRRQLKELNNSYQELLDEALSRENAYKNKISEQEQLIEEMKSCLEDSEALNRELRNLRFQCEKFLLEIQNKNSEIKELELKIQELFLDLQETKIDNIKKESEIDLLRSQLEGHPSSKITGAVNLETLLKRKEREIRIQHQKQIFDLKKQVDQIVEQKEREWNRSAEFSS